jgi:hypothetical protein
MEIELKSRFFDGWDVMRRNDWRWNGDGWVGWEGFSEAKVTMKWGGEKVDGLLQAMVEVVWPKARKTTEVFYWSLVVKNLWESTAGGTNVREKRMPEVYLRVVFLKNLWQIEKLKRC